MTKTKTLTLLLASAALTAAIGLPAWSAMHQAADGDAAAPLSSLFGSDEASRPMILADSEDGDDEGSAGTSNRAGDDDEDSCEEDEGNCGSAAAAPAPAGSVAPPQNGLFGTEPAQVQVK